MLWTEILLYKVLKTISSKWTPGLLEKFQPRGPISTTFSSKISLSWRMFRRVVRRKEIWKYTFWGCNGVSILFINVPIKPNLKIHRWTKQRAMRRTNRTIIFVIKLHDLLALFRCKFVQPDKKTNSELPHWKLQAKENTRYTCMHLFTLHYRLSTCPTSTHHGNCIYSKFIAIACFPVRYTLWILQFRIFVAQS